ncbi:type VI secretion system contractile sheath large subunit [Enterobacter ludwigii]|nr:type VI secretion system contractile sheath large subunit [Enterobacter ludwigii]
MLMSVKNENAAGNESVVLERPAAGGVYASLFEKINLNPVSELSALDIWQDAQAMSDATADERLTAGMKVFLECLTKAGSKVEKLDKNLIDHHIAELDYQISRQLDAVMHHEDFQAVESLWRGVKSLVDKIDFRQNVKVELLDMSKEDLRQDFEDCPEIVQSGLYKHTYIDEYDTPGGEPIAALISAYEFDASAQDVALLRNISKVSAAAHMPFIGSAGPKFFLKDNMEDVAAIKDIGNYFDRAEYIKWKSFRETDDSRYIGLVMPRVLGRLPYGPDNLSFQSWLARVTQVRLKLQQVTSAPDPQAMSQMLAQTVFQGKAIDLTDTRDYGSLVAASLGQEWNGFGQSLFVQPLDLAWRQVLAPAAGSLNARWQSTIVEQWNKAFAGRYPFKATGSDASLPLLAQFLRSDSGRITTFLKTNLGGILHQEGNRWVVDLSASQGMVVSPDFLRAINQLAELSDIVFSQGDAGVHFELMTRPSRDVARVQFTLDEQNLD